MLCTHDSLHMLCLFTYSGVFLFFFEFRLVPCVPNVFWNVHLLIAPSVLSNVNFQFDGIFILEIKASKTIKQNVSATMCQCQ